MRDADINIVIIRAFVTLCEYKIYFPGKSDRICNRNKNHDKRKILLLTDNIWYVNIIYCIGVTKCHIFNICLYKIN